MWNRPDLPSLPQPTLNSSLSDCLLNMKDLKRVTKLNVYFYICLMWCKNKPSLKLVDYTTKIWFRLSQMWLFGEWLSHKALQSVCKRISVFFFFHFLSVDKWTSLSVVSTYLSGEGLRGLLYVKRSTFVPLRDSYESLNHLSGFWWHTHRIEQEGFCTKACLFDNGWDTVGPTNAVAFLRSSVWRYGSGAALCVLPCCWR